MSKNLHKGHRQRVRARYINSGLDSFEDHEALELLLFYCYPMIDTNEKAHKMINEFGTLNNLFDAHPLEIVRKCKVTENVATLVTLLPALSKRYHLKKKGDKISFNTSEEVAEYAKGLFMDKVYECFYVINLDKQRNLIYPELVSKGTIDRTHIYPRVIVEACLKHNASSVILTHNHPGGLLIASEADIDATEKIILALNSINISVIDHIIIAGNEHLSFRAKKIIEFNS